LAKDAIGDELMPKSGRASPGSSRSSPNDRHRFVATSCSARSGRSGSRALVVGVARREHPLSINVVNGTVSDAGYLRASEGAQAIVQFSDGSEVRFDNGPARASASSMRTALAS